MSARSDPAGGPGRPVDDDAYYVQLRREAREFLEGRGRRGGVCLYGEIETVVARHLAVGTRLPDADSSRRRLYKRATSGTDGYSPQAGWDLLHGFVVHFLFKPDDAQIYTALRQARDLDSFRRWLRKLLKRFLDERMHDDEAVRMRDNLLRGLDRCWRQSGLMRCGRRPNRYWSEAERSPQEAAAIMKVVDIEVSLDVAVRVVAEETVTLDRGRTTRFESGWGPAERGKMAAILAEALSAEVPGLGCATLIPEGPLKPRLTGLIEANFPELFTDPLIAPLGKGEEGAEEREVAGVRRRDPLDALGAADAALEMMERLTLHMEPSRPGGTSGADVTRAVRLYLDGRRSTRDAAAAWRTEPVEHRGTRPITPDSLAECMPEGIEAEPAGLRRERLETLCVVFRRPRFVSAPRSHVTVNALWARCWDEWEECCEGLSSMAEALAFHWFVDLLFAEVGRESPFATTDAAALALQDRAAAKAAATTALRVLRRRAGKSANDALLLVLRQAADGHSDDDVALTLDLDRVAVTRLRLVARDLIEKTWTTCCLLPGQRALAEDLLAAELDHEQAGGCQTPEG